MSQGLIFDIKRYAIHDGPGIRSTVFFKGCSLRCEWCHNPEGISSAQEIFYREERCAAGCRVCLPACPKKAIKKIKKSLFIDPARCDFCGECEQACVYEALQVAGRRMTVRQVMNEIGKDGVFYEESKGGVTFSGGEPLEQLEFLEDLLEHSKMAGLHTSVDTCGNYPPDSLESIWDCVDLFLYDLKMIDEKRHRTYTGNGNRLILGNLKHLAANGRPVAVRIPLVAGVNDDDRNIEKTVEFLQPLSTVNSVSLLPYHSGGEIKKKRLGKKKYPEPFRAPSTERIEQIRNAFFAKGFSVKIGG